ncbi:DinB family protein [Emticicia sp. SJ17W-69]|uniref:DinB family protein n=1 Tax=Emticicia sp. SJ17W-69 TaxID=3421657 RepID=UPI003EC0F58A
MKKIIQNTILNDDIIMKKIILILSLLTLCLSSFSQTTENNDLKIVIENLNRTKVDLIKATDNLTPAQWNFKESSERWSIAEIVEHLSIWEILWNKVLQVMTQNKPQPELRATCLPDSYYKGFIMEEKQHVSAEITHPRGFIKDQNTIVWFTKFRDINIKFAENLKIDMRDYFERTAMPNPRNMYNVYIYVWGHIDRHIRQINKVKAHPNYPK